MVQFSQWFRESITDFILKILLDYIAGTDNKHAIVSGVVKGEVNLTNAKFKRHKRLLGDLFPLQIESGTIGQLQWNFSPSKMYVFNFSL